MRSKLFLIALLVIGMQVQSAKAQSHFPEKIDTVEVLPFEIQPDTVMDDSTHIHFREKKVPEKALTPTHTEHNNQHITLAQIVLQVLLIIRELTRKN